MKRSDSSPICYAIYTRQSVARPADFSSCQAQFDHSETHVRTQVEKHVWVGTRFDDPGSSGGSLDRQGLTRLRALAAARGIDRIYVTALDRLSRRVVDLVPLLAEFEQAGVVVHIAQASLPPDGAPGRLIQNILVAFAQFEREMTASRISDTRAYLRREGRRLAGPVPLGYRADPRTKQFVPIAREALRVRLIFERAASGQSPALIAARINHLKWRTKSWVAQRSGQMRGGGKWTARQVLYVLRNPVYTGQHRSADGPRPGCHEPIVDVKLFDRVQTILATRRTITNPTRRPRNFPLRGKIICPKCGRHLSTQIRSRPLKHGRVQFHVYSCRSSAGGRAPCRGVHYPAHDVEQFVCQQLATPALWRQLLLPDQAEQTEAFATAWSALGDRMQNDLIGQMVERVTFRRKNTAMRITFTDRCRDVISARIQGSSADSVNHPVAEEADSF